MVYYGVDVSAIQGNIDFSWLKNNGYWFIICRNFVGNDFKDAMCNTNLAKGKAAGLKTAIYNFCYILPDAAGHANRNPEDQAILHFNNTPKGEIVCVDLEFPAPGPDWTKWGVDAAFINDWVYRYLEKYKQLSGLTSKQLFLYTYPDFAKHVKFRPEIAEYPLWYANYSNLPVVAPWSDWVIEQTSGGNKLTLPNGSQCDVDQVRDLSLWDMVQESQPSVPVVVQPSVILESTPIILPQAPTLTNTTTKPNIFQKIQPIIDTVKPFVGIILDIIKVLFHIK